MNYYMLTLTITPPLTLTLTLTLTQVWLEDGTLVGGCDATMDWCRAFVSVGESTPLGPVPNTDAFDPNVRNIH